MAGTLSMMSPGFAMSLIGMSKGAKAAQAARDEFGQAMGSWLPNTSEYQQSYFNDAEKYLPQAAKLSHDASTAQWDTTMGLRERGLPGYTQGMQQAGEALWPLLRGELPSGVMDAFTRAGGASTVGMGFGGSGFGAINTGLFGARGALGAMQTGYGLLPALLGAMPNVDASSTMNFLNQGVMNPMQRTQTQLAVRGQNIGIAQHLAGMPTSQAMWGQGLTSMGGQIMGADAATLNTAIGAVGGAAGKML